MGRAWSAWLTEGKATFLKAMAAKDDEHKALLDQHNRRKQQHDLAVKEVMPTTRGQTWQFLRQGDSLSISQYIEVYFQLTYAVLPSHPISMFQAERLRLEYDRMEDWKESRCRCCPKCGRVVEKLSGCDLMVCGEWVDAYTCLLACLPAGLCVVARREGRGKKEGERGGIRLLARPRQ